MRRSLIVDVGDGTDYSQYHYFRWFAQSYYADGSYSDTYWLGEHDNISAYPAGNLLSRTIWCYMP